MSFILYMLAAAAGGFIAGMGMGGGTILIPVLSIFFGAPQHTAQAVNLIAFIPMSVAALAVHGKKGYVDYKSGWKIIIPALLFAFIGSFIAKNMSATILKRLFGFFLIILAVIQYYCVVKKKD